MAQILFCRNILRKPSAQTFKPSRAAIGRRPVTWFGAVSRCAVVGASSSAEWSLSASSFSSGSIWNPLHSLTITGGPLFFLSSPFPRIILHHGRQKEPYQVTLCSPAVDSSPRPSRPFRGSTFRMRLSLFSPSTTTAAAAAARGAFLPFSLAGWLWPRLATAVPSLWRLLAPTRTQPLKTRQRDFLPRRRLPFRAGLVRLGGARRRADVEIDIVRRRFC